MTALADLQDSQAWRGAVVAAGLNALAMPMDLVVAHGVLPMPAWAPLGSAAVGFALVAVLVAARRGITVRAASAIFLINILAILVALWVTSGVWALAGSRWIPFQANKLGVLATALLAPDLLSGLIAIAGFVVLVVVRYETFAPALRHSLPVGEPWSVLIYGLFAGALLTYRLQGVALERRVLRLNSEAAATEKLARTFLAVRDYTNTPLQTIELAVEVIRNQNPELGPILDRIDRSVNRLFRLNHTFSGYDSYLKWTADEVSVDPNTVIGDGGGAVRD